MAIYLISGLTSFQQLEEKTGTVPLLVQVLLFVVLKLLGV